jgi:hypothetical protein
MAVFLNINLLVFDILPKIYVVVKPDIRPVPVLNHALLNVCKRL